MPADSHSTNAQRNFWGYLISRERPTQPTPLFRNLLLAIGNYVIEHFEPKDAKCLTPEKMSSFYHAVGGDLDELFLQTPPTQLSSIYTTLGCSHSLQPTPGDDFVAPSIPALTPRGFAIWQTIQLLLDPEEHVPYLQEATRKFPLLNPDTGERFPREIPKESFPREPDTETVQWHDEMFNKKSAAPPPPENVVQVPVPAVPVPPEEPWGAYYGGDVHARNREKRRGRKSRHASGTGGDNLFPGEVLYSRSAPGPTISEFAPTSHPHHHTGPTSPVCNSPCCSSDSEGYHTGQRRQHSRHDSSGRKPKPYIYHNGVVTPVAMLHPDPPMSPPMVPMSQHRRSHPNLHTYPVVVPVNSQHVPISISSSYSDLRGEYHAHTHPHPSPTKSSRHRSSSPPLRKPRSGSHYYTHESSNSRERSHSRSANVFSDSEEEIDMGEGGWRSGGEGRRQQEQRELERLERERERERQRAGANGWGYYQERSEYDRAGGPTVDGRYKIVGGVGLGVDRGAPPAGEYYY
ncbi:hypothetical protein RUND412_008572 [Rhizina undulata]